MGSLIDELQRREAAAHAEVEELRGRIAELAERLAQAEERLSRLVITRETVEEVLDSAATEIAANPVNIRGQRTHRHSVAELRASEGCPGSETMLM